MIDWMSFVVVAVASLVGASVLVMLAALGLRLFESGSRARSDDARAGRVTLAFARTLFGMCGLLVLYGVYLIVPFFH